MAENYNSWFTSRELPIIKNGDDLLKAFNIVKALFRGRPDLYTRNDYILFINTLYAALKNVTDFSDGAESLKLNKDVISNSADDIGFIKNGQIIKEGTSFTEFIEMMFNGLNVTKEKLKSPKMIGDESFYNNTLVTLINENDSDNTEIYYSIEDSTSSHGARIYMNPFYIKENTKLTTWVLPTCNASKLYSKSSINNYLFTKLEPGSLLKPVFQFSNLDNNRFYNNTILTILNPNKIGELQYSINGSEYKKYTEPILIEESSNIKSKIISDSNEWKSSQETVVDIIKLSAEILLAPVINIVSDYNKILFTISKKSTYEDFKIVFKINDGVYLEYNPLLHSTLYSNSTITAKVLSNNTTKYIDSNETIVLAKLIELVSPDVYTSIDGVDNKIETSSYEFYNTLELSKLINNNISKENKQLGSIYYLINNEEPMLYNINRTISLYLDETKFNSWVELVLNDGSVSKSDIKTIDFIKKYYTLNKPIIEAEQLIFDKLTIVKVSKNNILDHCYIRYSFDNVFYNNFTEEELLNGITIENSCLFFVKVSVKLEYLGYYKNIFEQVDSIELIKNSIGNIYTNAVNPVGISWEELNDDDELEKITCETVGQNFLISSNFLELITEEYNNKHLIEDVYYGVMIGSDVPLYIYSKLKNGLKGIEIYLSNSNADGWPNDTFNTEELSKYFIYESEEIIDNEIYYKYYLDKATSGISNENSQLIKFIIK